MASIHASALLNNSRNGHSSSSSPHDHSDTVHEPLSATSGRDRRSIDSIDSIDHAESPDQDDAQREAKRQRITKACDHCRQKKIKCDGRLPKCSYCTAHRTDCLFTYSNKKRQPPRSAKYVEALEARVAHMESLLQSAGLLGADGALPGSSSAASRSPTDNRSSMPSISVSNASPAGSQTQSPVPVNLQAPSHARPYLPDAQYARRKREPESGGVEDLADEMCSLVTTNLGETKYIGSSSCMTIISPRGTQWVKEKTGDEGFQKLVADMTQRSFTWFHWKPEIFGDLFIRRTYQPLPSKMEAISLLKLYFEHCNALFPLFHEPTFMHLAEKQYSHDPFEGSGWWACLNVALAISYRMRAHGDHERAPEDNRKAWLFMKNSLAVMSELTLRNNDLLSVQALAGMALFLQGTPNPFLSFYFVGAAIRLAQGLGLHKRGNHFNLNNVETEQRKRVFWILYMLDTDHSLRAGRPAAQDGDDMNIGLPSENPVDQVGTIMVGKGSVVGEGTGSRVNLFRKLCEFAEIQAQVYKRLYADRASRQTDSQLLGTIGDLDKQLEDWKDSLPPEVRPEHEIKVALPYAFSVMVLHFAYYNCLTTIHRTSVLHGSWTARRSCGSTSDHPNQDLYPRVFMSAALCVNAARTSIMLVNKLPPLHNGYTWIVMYYPVSALCQLFSNILQNPTDARGESDLKLMQGVVEWLSTLSDEDSDEYVKRMKLICSEFERVSRMALEKARREQQARGTRQTSNNSNNGRHSRNASSNAPGAQHAASNINGGAGQRSAAAAEGQAAHVLQQQQQPDGGPTLQQQQSGVDVHQQMPAAAAEAAPNFVGAPSTDGTSSWMHAGEGSASTFPPLSNMNAVNMEYVNTYGEVPMGANGLMDTFDDGGFGGNFQRPFANIDLYKMPMTIEWDWAQVWPQGFDFGLDGNGDLPADQQNNGM